MRSLARLSWCAVLLLPSLALARANSDVGWAQGECFSTAVRFVRVDRGCKVTDKDADAAFVTFECSESKAKEDEDEKKEDKKVKRGSVEIIRSGDGSKLQVSLPDEPHYMELRFLELLERKLKEERGTPIAAPKKEKPIEKNPPDGGSKLE